MFTSEEQQFSADWTKHLATTTFKNSDNGPGTPEEIEAWNANETVKLMESPVNLWIELWERKQARMRV